MTRVLVLGGSGMVGHVVANVLQESGVDVVAIARRGTPGVQSVRLDVERDIGLLAAELCRGYDVVMNFVGVLNVDANSNSARTVWLNSWFPHWLRRQAAESGAWLVHMSTDCVFSGDRGGYRDADPPDARDLYGRSKALGELTDGAMTIRTSVVGPDLHESGTGLFNWFMAQDGTVEGYAGVSWSGVTTLQLAESLTWWLSRDRASGLKQLANGKSISKHDLLLLFNRNFPRERLSVVRQASPRSDKSLVPSTDIPPVPSYAEQIARLREWVGEHAEFYPHYSMRT